MPKFNQQVIHASWRPIIRQALSAMEPHYLQQLQQDTDWLPGAQHIFSAFSLPLNKTRYILFGESPYPRSDSANGYAFWDAKVDSLWSSTGMSTAVNRATSLRNLLKMLMLATGTLSADNTSQTAIAKLNKTTWIQTLNELFANLLNQGFLLLNTNLVLSDRPVTQEKRDWQPFIASILSQLTLHKISIKLILLGKISESITGLPAAKRFSTLLAEHPYNLSFIHNQEILQFFKPFNLLQKPI